MTLGAKKVVDSVPQYRETDCFQKDFGPEPSAF